jgi:hypothetical protein
MQTISKQSFERLPVMVTVTAITPEAKANVCKAAL